MKGLSSPVSPERWQWAQGLAWGLDEHHCFLSGVDKLHGIRPLTHGEDTEVLSSAHRQLGCYKEAVPASLFLLLRTRRGRCHPFLLLCHPPTHPGLESEGH